MAFASLIWPEVHKTTYPYIFMQVCFSSPQQGKKSTHYMAWGEMSHTSINIAAGKGRKDRAGRN